MHTPTRVNNLSVVKYGSASLCSFNTRISLSLARYFHDDRTWAKRAISPIAEQKKKRTKRLLRSIYHDVTVTIGENTQTDKRVDGEKSVRAITYNYWFQRAPSSIPPSNGVCVLLCDVCSSTARCWCRRRSNNTATTTSRRRMKKKKKKEQIDVYHHFFANIPSVAFLSLCLARSVKQKKCDGEWTQKRQWSLCVLKHLDVLSAIEQVNNVSLSFSCRLTKRTDNFERERERTAQIKSSESTHHLLYWYQEHGPSRNKNKLHFSLSFSLGARRLSVFRTREEDELTNRPLRYLSTHVEPHTAQSSSCTNSDAIKINHRRF